MNVTVVCMLAAVAGCCRASYTFFQTYHSYVNPQHNRGDTGQCCESQTRPPCTDGSFCDNVFTLCVQETSHSLPDPGNIRQQDCPLGHTVSQTFFNSDNITFDTSSPITSSGDIWPGSFRLVVQVFDADQGNPDDFVDILVVEQILSPSDSFTSPTAYTSEAGIFTIVISFRVECSENLYGERCDVFCKPANDSNQGFYYCDSEGQRVCFGGYQNPETNCTETVTAGGTNFPECDDGVRTNCTTGRSGKEDNNVVAGVVVGVVVSVLVIVTVVAVAMGIVILLKKTDIILRSSTKVQMPGDNPIYMSSTDVNEVSSSALHSPTHSSASPPSRATDVTPIEDLVPEDQNEIGEVPFDDAVYSSSSSYRHPPNPPGKLNPYGNYGDSTITRVAGDQLFDDSKYVWCPPSRTDSDDVDSDYQSEYL